MNSGRRAEVLNITDENWKFLLGRIKAGKCTPFLGAGASSGVFPLGSDIARGWAKEYKYPMADSYDLARVAQFVAVTVDPMEPKDRIQQQFQAIQLPDFTSPDEPHGVLADLPFPIYITTNYDSTIMSALKARKKDPKLELCRWNSYLEKNIESVFDKDPTYTPSVANPLVFHLHGHYSVVESMVLTEDDYLDFLIHISEDEKLLPSCIKKAMTGSSLLFLGYKIADWDFRVLFRSMVGYLEKSLGRTHISVQIAPEHEGIPRDQQENAQKYLESYYARDKVHVYWGSFSDFAEALKGGGNDGN
jgi:SIR2-like domain